MKRFLSSATLLLFLASSAAADTLTVAVAASAQYAFAEIAVAFNKRTGHEVRPIFNSSGKIAAQITHGAPFDVFMSADMDYPQKLHHAGMTAGPPTVYAQGALVLWTLNDLDLGDWKATLTDARVRKLAIPNPKVAPYGRETMNLLARIRLEDALKPKLVYGESVAQTNQYVHSRTVDAGFTAKSVVMAPEMRGQGKWIDMPADAYQPIAQGIVILRHGQRNNRALAQQFHDFVLSAEARAIFDRYGYLSP